MHLPIQVVGVTYNPNLHCFWDIKGQNRGSKWVKTCPSPDKSQYKCYFWAKGHMRTLEDGKVTWFDISPKLTLFFCGYRVKPGGQNGSKRAKTCPFPDKSQ